MRICTAIRRAILVAGAAIGSASAQDLEPRAYSISPVAFNAAVFAYGRSSGDVVFDPSLPVEDVAANVHSLAIGYYRSLSLFGRSANVRFAAPYAVANMQGLLSGTQTAIYRSGLADSRAQFSVNLRGAPSMNLRQFAEHRPSTTIWTSLAVSIPTGQYDPGKLINIGANRWAFKPELAVSRPIGKWTADVYVGAWLFSSNSQFQGNVRKQRPLFAYQGHLSYNLKRALWVAADLTYYHGGSSLVNGEPRKDFLRSARGGLTVSIPVKKQQSVKLLYSTTSYARLGGKFRTLSVAYSYSWMDR